LLFPIRPNYHTKYHFLLHEDFLADGGFGTVFKAILIENDPQDGSPPKKMHVAIKRYKVKINSETEWEYLYSMQQEVTVLKDNQHLLVVGYVDSFRDGHENAYLVTELA
jgi:serine/threonine protein kinase